MRRLLLAAITALSASHALADALVTKDAGGIIRITPYPVSGSFNNPAWPTPLEDAFDQRVTTYLNLLKTTSYGSTYFENEKKSYPLAMYSYLWGIANNNGTNTSSAKNFLIGNATYDTNDIGLSNLTEYVDLFPSFTLKGQMPKYFYFGQYSRSVLGAGAGYLDHTYPANASGIDAPWANKTYLERMRAAFATWANDNNPDKPDPYRRPNPYYTGPEGPGWTAGDRNSWVDVRNTDNLKLMREAAVYLFAHETGNTNNRDTYANRLRDHFTASFRTGLSEWDSQNYLAYSIDPLLSFHAFAPETINGQTNGLKRQAKAMLDLQFASAAMKYYRGGFGGPSKRITSTSNVTFGNSAAQQLWLYFGDHPTGPSAPDPNIMNVCMISPYRPPQAVVGLAQKDWQGGRSQVEMINVKPKYGNWDPANQDAPQTFETMFYGSTFEVGSAVSAGSIGDVDPFNVMARSNARGIDVFDAGPGGNFFTKRAGDQVGQYRNAAVWLRPVGLDGVNSFSFQAPTSATVDTTNPQAWFFRLADDQTWIALRPVNLNYGSSAPGTGSYTNETIHTANASSGDYFGFAMEIGELGTGAGRFDSYNAFKSAVLATSLDLSQVNAGVVQLGLTDGSFLRFGYAGDNDLPVVQRNSTDPYDWNNPWNWSLYGAVNNPPTISLNPPASRRADPGATIALNATAGDTGVRGPITLGWNTGQLSVLSGGFLFEETLAEDGTVSFSERTATTDDYLGRVTRIEFYADGILLGSSTDGTLNWTNPNYGVHEVTARAIDNDNQWALSSPMQIVVAILGDMDLDGSVNNQDIAPFVAALTGDPNVPSYLLDVGDIDGNGQLNNQDIAPFVALLTGSRGFPWNDRQLAPLLSLLPEPAALPLALLATTVCRRRRRR